VAARSDDWFRQAEHDLGHAEAAAAEGRFDWACFAAHQSAEKAVKALHLHHRQEAWGRVVARLLAELPVDVAAPADLIDAGKVLDTFYIPTRYPDSHAEGPPFVHYGRYQGEEAIRHARAIIGFVRTHLAGD
jgi:HEPN domain-containing protein